MRWLFLVLLCFLAVSAFSADGKQVSYKSGDDTVAGMVYTPAGKGPFPGLVVIHEWWGLNDWVKEQACGPSWLLNQYSGSSNYEGELRGDS